MALRTAVLVLCAVVWLGLTAIGFSRVLSHEFTPGKSALAPELWPAESSIHRVGGLPTLVMVAHPHCPCTRASLGELEWIMSRSHERVSAHVLFVRPEGTATDWGKTDLWRQAQATPGVEVHEDEGGRMASHFGASTSGQTFLYDAAGVLVFRGGITISRGHSGAGEGRKAVASLIAGTVAQHDAAPVFGCSVIDSSSQ